MLPRRLHLQAGHKTPYLQKHNSDVTQLRLPAQVLECLMAHGQHVVRHVPVSQGTVPPPPQPITTETSQQQQ